MQKGGIAVLTRLKSPRISAVILIAGASLLDFFPDDRSNSAFFIKLLAADGKVSEPTGVPRDDGQAIYLSDMKLCQPAGLITKRFRQGGWKAIDYETASFKGTMLQSVPNLGSQ